MLRTVRELGAAAAQPPRQATRTSRPRARSSTGCSTTTTSSMGTVQYRIGPDGLPDRAARERDRRLHRPRRCCPWCSPASWRRSRRTSCPTPSDHRIVDIDYCNNASAIYHLEPIDDIVIREWGADGAAGGGDAAAWAASPRAPSRRRRPTSRCSRRSTTGCSPHSGAAAELVRVPRDPRALQPLPQARAVLRERAGLKDIIDRIVYMTGDDEIAVHARARAGLRGALRRLLAPALLVQGRGRTCSQALADAFGPDRLQHLRRPGRGQPAPLLLRRRAPRAPGGRGRGPRSITEALVTTWEDRVAAALEARVRRARGAAAVRALHPPESRSGLYREATPPEEVPRGHPAPREPGGPARGRASCRAAPSTVDAEAVLGPRRSPSPTPCARCRTSGSTVTEELRIPLVLPDGRKALPLPLRDRGAAGAHRRAGRRARSASSTRCARSTRSARPTTR